MSGMLSVKWHVEGNQKVRLLFYRSGVLYYRTERGLVFEVPTSDCGDAVFNSEDRAMLFMRWIRKQIEAIRKGEPAATWAGRDAARALKRI